MTINSTTRKAGPFAGTGLQTAFPFAFKVFTASDMLVVQTNSLGIDGTLVLGTDYSVALNADQNANPGGTVNLTVALPVGFMLTLGSAVPATQGQSIPNNGGFFPKVIEDAFDKLTIEVQQLAEKIGRTLQYAFSDTASGGTMPPAAARANNLLGFDQNGNIVAVAPASGSATALQVLLATAAGASLIGNNPAGNIAATTVQGALNELDVEKVSLAGTETITGQKAFSLSPTLPSLAVGDTSLKAAPAKLVADSITANMVIRVRHAIQYGPTTGTPAASALIPQSQVGNTLAVGVTAKFSTKATLLSIANGFNADGSDSNVNVLLNADLTLAGLTASTTNIIAYDQVNNVLVKTVVSDTDTKGGTPAVTAGLYTLDYENWIMYLGNGATAVPVKHIILAEVDTNATVITAIRNRAYKRYAETPLTASTATTETTITHNLGTRRYSITGEIEAVSVDGGWAVGSIRPWNTTTNGTGALGSPFGNTGKNTILMSVNATWDGIPGRPTTSGVNTTQAAWQARTKIRGDY